MAKQVLFGTSNQAKILHIQEILRVLPLEILTPADLSIALDVPEDGLTPEENAEKKAVAYHQVSGMPAFAIDSGLLIDGLSKADQPGVFVKRVRGVRNQVTDEDLMNHYAEKLNALGGESIGTWHSCIVLVVSEDEVLSKSLSLRTQFTSERSNALTPGAPLNSLMTDPITGRYFSEMAYEDRPDSKGIAEFLSQHLDRL